MIWRRLSWTLIYSKPATLVLTKTLRHPVRQARQAVEVEVTWRNSSRKSEGRRRSLKRACWSAKLLGVGAAAPTDS